MIAPVIPISLTYVWVVIAVSFFIGEVFAPTFFYMCLGLACCCSALSSAAGLSLNFQIVAFIAGVSISLAVVRPTIKRFFLRRGQQTNVYALVGKQAVILETVRAMQPGRVRVEGEDWRALPASHGEFIAGDQVSVTRIEGATLYIERSQKKGV